MRTAWQYFAAGLVSVGLASLVVRQANTDLDLAKERFKKDSTQQAKGVAGGVAFSFMETFRALNSVAQMQGVRRLGKGGTRLSGESESLILHSFTDLRSEDVVRDAAVYVFDAKRNPAAVKTVSGKTIRLAPSALKVVRYQYGYLKQNFPFERNVSQDRRPGICGPIVDITLSGSPESTKCFAYSVPVYGMDGKMMGIATAFMPSRTLLEMLPDGNHALVAPVYKFAETLKDHGTFFQNSQVAREGLPVSAATYSDVIQLPIRDETGAWGVWVCLPESQLANRVDVYAVGQLLGFGLTGSAVIACLMFAFVWASNRSRKEMEEANTKLESEVRERTTKLIHARKMESIGQLAAGIAHEINTPTQFIGDNVRFIEMAFGKRQQIHQIQERLAEAHTAGEDTTPIVSELVGLVQDSRLRSLRLEIPDALNECLDGVERITEIVRAMKDYAHPGVDSAKESNLNKIVSGSVTVTRNEWKYVAKVDLDLSDSLPLVHCHPGEIGQVVVNLVVNAAHAIKDAGLENGHIKVSTHHEGDKVVLTIQDNGCGIPLENQARIFDQFFTTKDVGVGTGMGLAIAKRVVDRHHGELSLESEPGKGTKFVITLPIEAVQTEEEGEELAA